MNRRKRNWIEIFWCPLNHSELNWIQICSMEEINFNRLSINVNYLNLKMILSRKSQVICRFQYQFNETKNGKIVKLRKTKNYMGDKLEISISTRFDLIKLLFANSESPWVRSWKCLHAHDENWRRKILESSNYMTNCRKSILHLQPFCIVTFFATLMSIGLHDRVCTSCSSFFGCFPLQTPFLPQVLLPAIGRCEIFMNWYNVSKARDNIMESIN